jgi:hypothetical protein
MTTVGSSQQSVDRPPNVVSAAVPFYPPGPRMANVEGDVWLKVSTDGKRVSSVEVESGQPMLAQAAEDNVRTWEFREHKPTTFDVRFRYRLLPEFECDPDSGTAQLHLPVEVEVTAKRIKICDETHVEVRTCEGPSCVRGILWLGLLVRQPKVCLSKPEVPLEVELRNVSDHHVLINKHAVRYSISFTKGAKSEQGKVAFLPDQQPGGRIPPAPTDQWADLAPQQSLRTVFDYRLTGDFFSKPGTYRVRVVYDPPAVPPQQPGKPVARPLQSNEVTFKLVDCGDSR